MGTKRKNGLASKMARQDFAISGADDDDDGEGWGLIECGGCGMNLRANGGKSAYLCSDCLSDVPKNPNEF